MTALLISILIMVGLNCIPVMVRHTLQKPEKMIPLPSNYSLIACSIICLFSFVIPSGFGQIPKHLFNEDTYETYNPNDFTISTRSIKQKVGVYHFGESEGEWDFLIIPNGDSLIIQIWSGTWAQNIYTNDFYWQKRCKTFNHVILDGNKIAFGIYTGLFADFKYENKTTRSLLLYCDPIGERNYEKDSAEIGFYNTSIDTFYHDKELYELSINIKPEQYFKDKTKDELKIMRNTVFARYGLIFKSGGEMEKYFKTKTWYNPYLKDVSDCLTEIEKRNIQTIISLEQR